MISVSVVYAPGAGRREAAAAIADAAASRVLDRFMDYAKGLVARGEACLPKRKARLAGVRRSR
jgi:hypothetical protein